MAQVFIIGLAIAMALRFSLTVFDQWRIDASVQCFLRMLVRLRNVSIGGGELLISIITIAIVRFVVTAC